VQLLQLDAMRRQWWLVAAGGIIGACLVVAAEVTTGNAEQIGWLVAGGFVVLLYASK